MFSNIISVSQLSVAEVFDALRAVNNSFTSGVDGVPSFLLKDCVGIFSILACYLFNLILRSSKLPSIWKEPFVGPMFKRADVDKVHNYREISMLRNFSKRC